MTPLQTIQQEAREKLLKIADYLGANGAELVSEVLPLLTRAYEAGRNENNYVDYRIIDGELGCQECGVWQSIKNEVCVGCGKLFYRPSPPTDTESNE